LLISIFISNPEWSYLDREIVIGNGAAKVSKIIPPEEVYFPLEARDVVMNIFTTRRKLLGDGGNLVWRAVITRSQILCQASK
jgi:hypothetical protein